jgi:predicted small secreted protein
MINIMKMRLLSLPLLLLAFVVTGCDNPVGSGGGHPEGLVVTNAQGAEVATFLQSGTRTGQLTVATGGESTYRIQLLARDGSRIQLDGLEYSIRTATVTTALYASATIVGADQLRVSGRNVAGSTTLFLDVWHGNHSEFVAVVNLLVQ